ncbi:MAG: dihydrodipicolinate synthase family protein [Bryobacterales bacterium]|nr:dihydrodipicolinate synthase family protein [Bryobacterales bacterium]
MALNGILPAILTPLDEHGKLDASAYEQLLTRLHAAGVHGIYAAGQTGEGPLLSLEDRMKIAEISAANSPREANVIIHVGAHRTADAIQLVRHASRIGVTAVSSLPPIGVYSFPEIRSYYQALAANTEVPFLVYYFPALAPAITSIGQILELCEIPNVAGLKFTAYDLYSLQQLKRHGYTVYNGHDEVLAAGLLMGADGGIGTFYNLVPELFLDIYRKAKANDWKGAMESQTLVNELVALVLRYPAISAVKRMMSWAGVPCGDAAAPRQTLTRAEEEHLLADLANSSFRGMPFAGRRVSA